MSEGSGRIVLLTGGTGYIGGRLLSRLLGRRGIRVRCMARRPEHLRAALASRAGSVAGQHDSAPDVEVVAGDCLDPESLAPALAGVHTAFYLVHSMAAERGFAEVDRAAAMAFAAAARQAGVHRIIYLGGLGNPADRLSEHLRSRHEVGQLLRQSGAEVIEFRASVIIGSGSLSYELIRALVERLPVMLCPKWVATPTQPIAVEDVLDYLMGSLDLPGGESRVFEIGGPDRVCYGDIMREYARQRGLRRWMISVPVLTPYLSSLWLGLVTPVYARIGRHLVESLRNPTVVNDRSAEDVFRVHPRGLSEAIQLARANEDREFAETRWSDALSVAGPIKSWGGVRFGTRIVDSRTIAVAASAEKAFEAVTRIGGSTGWYFGNGLWRVRGWIDLLCGGVGLRRGRRDPRHLRVGDVVDCWRVEQFEPAKRLRLRAEMKLPGRAWLEFEAEDAGRNAANLRQTAVFDPLGLAGLAYWYALYPVHCIMFAGMLRGIARAAEQHLAAERHQSGDADLPRAANDQ